MASVVSFASFVWITAPHFSVLCPCLFQAVFQSRFALTVKVSQRHCKGLVLWAVYSHSCCLRVTLTVVVFFFWSNRLSPSRAEVFTLCCQFAFQANLASRCWLTFPASHIKSLNAFKNPVLEKHFRRASEVQNAVCRTCDDISHWLK